jgi:hypothetical protein
MAFIPCVHCGDAVGTGPRDSGTTHRGLACRECYREVMYGKVPSAAGITARHPSGGRRLGTGPGLDGDSGGYQANARRDLEEG